MGPRIPKTVRGTRVKTYWLTAAEVPTFIFVPSGCADTAYDELVANGSAIEGPTLSHERAKVYAETCVRFIERFGKNANNFPQALFVNRPNDAALLKKILAEINEGDLLQDSDERRSVDDENESSLSDFIDDAPVTSAGAGPAPADSSSDDDDEPPRATTPKASRGFAAMGRRRRRRCTLDTDEDNGTGEEEVEPPPRRRRAAVPSHDQESDDSKGKGKAPARIPQYGDDDFDY